MTGLQDTKTIPGDFPLSTSGLSNQELALENRM